MFQGRFWGKQQAKKGSALLEDQTGVFFVLMWALVSSSVPGWGTVCSQAGRQFLAAETWWQSFSSLQPQKHKAQPPNMIPLDFFSVSAKPLFLLPSLWVCFVVWVFFQLETYHILEGGKNPNSAYCLKNLFIFSKKCLQGPAEFPVISATEKPETLWEVIFQSTKTAAQEISADGETSHCSPKQRPRFELLALRCCGVTDGMGKPGQPPPPFLTTANYSKHWGRNG